MQQRRFIAILGFTLILAASIYFLAGGGTSSVSQTYANSDRGTAPKTTSPDSLSNDKEPIVKQEQINPAPAPDAPVSPKAESAPPTAPSNQNYQSFGEILRARGIPGDASLSIVVEKRLHRLSLYYNNLKLKSYHVEMGDNGLGDKEVSGDHKTPEGVFYITERLEYNPADHFLGNRWMRLSYPNIEDAERGLTQGIIDRGTYQMIVQANRTGETPPQRTALGGGVGIHGGSTRKFGPNWTWGCVGLTNADVSDFYDYIKVGTPVVIRK